MSLMLQDRTADPSAMPSCCPNCGFNIVRAMPFRLGKLFIDKSDSAVWWGDKVVPLTTSKRLIVAALARAHGSPLSRACLAELEGYEGDEPVKTASTLICQIRKAFRSIDPSFDRIETVWGQGVRWRL